MSAPEAQGRDVFLVGAAGAFAGALEAAGFRVLGHVGSLDLLFPLARHAQAQVVLYGPDPGDRLSPGEAVAQLRILLPRVFLAVVAEDGAAELAQAGTDQVFLPPFDPARIAAALGGVPPRGLPGNGHGGWTVSRAGAAGGDGPALALLREAAWRSRAPHAPEPRPRPQQVAVLGSRGGVGKTFVAANLAAVAALAGVGRVLLLDLGGSSPAPAAPTSSSSSWSPPARPRPSARWACSSTGWRSGRWRGGSGSGWSSTARGGTRPCRPPRWSALPG